MLPKSLKKTYNCAKIIATKMRFCKECMDTRTCNRCNSQVNENKEFEAILNELKRQPPNNF